MTYSAATPAEAVPGAGSGADLGRGGPRQRRLEARHLRAQFQQRSGGARSESSTARRRFAPL